MSLIPFPTLSQACPVSMTLRPHAVTRAHASPFGGEGAESVVDLLQDRWHASLELSPSQLQDARAIEAWLNAQRGGANTTPLWHMGSPVPLGTLGRVYPVAGVSGDVPQGSDIIYLAAVPGATLLAGDMFRVGGDAAGQGGLLLQCAADCVANSVGTMVVPLVNRLRRALVGHRRASTATYVDAGGVLQTAGVHELRYQGGVPLVEPQATNYCTNNNDATPTKYTSGDGDGTITPVSDPFWPTVLRITKTAGAAGGRIGVAWPVAAVPGSAYALGVWLRKPPGVTAGYGPYCDMAKAGGGFLTASAPISSAPDSVWFRATASAFESGASFIGGFCYAWLEGVVGDYIDVALPCVWPGLVDSSAVVTEASPATRAADVITAVEWNRPARPFRLASGAGLRHVAGYAEGLALDFLEDLQS